MTHRHRVLAPLGLGICIVQIHGGAGINYGHVHDSAGSGIDTDHLRVGIA